MPEKQVLITIIASAMLFIVGTIVIVLFVFRYIRKKQQHKEMLEVNEKKFQAELIKTELEIQEQTRKNLAADLHDNIGQLLSLTNVTLGSINIEDKEKAIQKISDTKELVTRSIKELRQLSKIIHGEQLIREGLITTIEQEIAWLQRNGFYTVELSENISDLDISNPDKDLFLYRLLQESLNNAIKHSGADHFQIKLHYTAGTMELCISDNGVGFNVQESISQSTGLGLFNMQKRINLLNGTMQISSAENKGTILTFTIPYP
jgi:signal transduction histidine kinase